jgi:ABC-type multidrug transport system permease subunit
MKCFLDISQILKTFHDNVKILWYIWHSIWPLTTYYNENILRYQKNISQTVFLIPWNVFMIWTLFVIFFLSCQIILGLCQLFICSWYLEKFPWYQEKIPSYQEKILWYQIIYNIMSTIYFFMISWKVSLILRKDFMISRT